MLFVRKFLLVISLSSLLASCQFQCKVGNASEKSTGNDRGGKPLEVDGAIVYNGIELKTDKVKLNKAYLVFKNTGDRVPSDNFVDFNEPVKLILLVDSGWVVQDGKSSLGAGESIITEKGETLLDEKDLFGAMTDSINMEDAKTIGLTASIILPAGTPPTSFTVNFRVWDKMGDGVIEGSYKLFSK